MEGFQSVYFLTGSDKLDRLARDRFDRERSASARIAVHLCQNDSGQAQALVKLLGAANSILTCHGVRNQQNLGRRNRLADPFELHHHLVVDMQPPGGVYDYNVVPAVARITQSLLRARQRIGIPCGVEISQSVVGAENSKLFHSRGTIDVHRKEQRGVVVFREPVTELCRRGGFSGTLEPNHQKDGRRLLVKLQLCLVAPQQLHQLVAHNFHYLLGGGQGIHDFLSQRALLYSSHEILRDLVMDVGIQQRIANLPSSLLEMAFGDTALASQVPKDLL